MGTGARSPSLLDLLLLYSTLERTYLDGEVIWIGTRTEVAVLEGGEYVMSEWRREESRTSKMFMFLEGPGLGEERTDSLVAELLSLGEAADSLTVGSGSYSVRVDL